MDNEANKNNTSLHEKDKTKTDPQENEMDGNVLGAAFETVFGDSQGKHSLSEESGDHLEEKAEDK